MSRVEHILVLLQQAGSDYEELISVENKLLEIIQEPSLDQQEMEILKEIQFDINERLEAAVEISFENQVIAESEAQVNHYPVGRGGQAVRGGRGAHGAHRGNGGHGAHVGHGRGGGHNGNIANGEIGIHEAYDEQGGHGGPHAGSNNSRGVA